MPPVLYEKKDGIAYVTYNRPEAMNAIDPETSRLFTEAWDDFKNDPQVLVGILTGVGDKAFCAGADLKSSIPNATSAARSGTGVASSHRFGDDIYKPIIAAINGYCLAGGLETVLGTDLRIAAEHATFALQEVRWAIAPIGGSHIRLPRQIPYCRAMEILLVGDRISAQEALQIGLINKVVPLPELMPTAERLARRLMENGPLALRTIKEITLRGLSMPMDQGFHLEALLGQKLFSSEDSIEGPRAFAEKRKPVYKGR